VAGHQVYICSTNTLKARSMGTLSRTFLRTTASATGLGMFLSFFFGFFFGSGLKGVQRVRPHLVEMSAEARDAFGVQLIQAAGSFFAVEDKACVFQYAEVLGNRWTAYGQSAGKFVDSNRSGREFLEDRHTAGVAQGVKAGL
jgi:hypothetical protein